MDRYAARYWEGASRGARWLLAQQAADGSFSPIDEGVDAYYKIPYALSVTGYPIQAQRLIDWAMSGALTSEGDLRGRAVKSQNVWHQQFYTYSNSWMTIGAQRLGRFDFAGKAMAYILKYQSAANGGIFSEPDSVLTGKGRQDMVCSSQAGSACLYMGRWSEAIRIGDWFVCMLDSQPGPETLYACSDPGTGLIRAFGDGEATMYVVDASRKLQWYFYPGIAMGFLAKLYLATRRQEYLDASAGYFEFTRRCASDVHCTPPSGKLGWGSAQMYWITGEDKYLKAAREVADYLLQIQQADGEFVVNAEEEAAGYLRVDLTAEFVVWLAEIAQHLDR